MSAVVFLGPSLRHASAKRLLEARFLPPARRGDIYRAVRALDPRVIVLVDGVFHEEPAVWHREILWAMSEGVHAIGAASMGALRAAELATYGMRGVGRIFEAYRAGRFAQFPDAFEDDAEVAVAHGPAELGAAPLTVALVDVRHALAAAASRGEIEHAEADDALDAARRVFFAERTPERLLVALRTTGLPLARCEAILAATSGEANSLKSSDAAEALRACAALLAQDPPPFEPGFLFERTLVWENFRRRAATADAAAGLRTTGARTEGGR